ncbi:DUF4236 domain-containing protein, partial [Pseudomonas aeruginosa]
MGLSVRKSVRVGPFRFNLSKSGIGVSAVSVWPTHLPDPSCSRHGVHLFLVDT